MRFAALGLAPNGVDDAIYPDDVPVESGVVLTGTPNQLPLSLPLGVHHGRDASQ